MGYLGYVLRRKFCLLDGFSPCHQPAIACLMIDESSVFWQPSADIVAPWVVSHIARYVCIYIYRYVNMCIYIDICIDVCIYRYMYICVYI